MGTTNKIQKKMRHGLVIQYFLDRISAYGISFRPFYLVEEGGNSCGTGQLNPEVPSCQPVFLTRAEIKGMARHEETIVPEKELLARIEEGCRCFGLKHNSEILAYMWCRFTRGGSWKRFELKRNEVYLFDAWTYKVHRGKNIAPYLRYQLYDYLHKMGYKKFYSITEAFNTPSKKFKRKLGAKNLKLYFHISLSTNGIKTSF